MSWIDEFRINPQALLEVAYGINKRDISNISDENIENAYNALTIIADIVNQTEPGTLEWFLAIRIKLLNVIGLAEDLGVGTEFRAIHEAKRSKKSKDEAKSLMVDMVQKVEGCSVNEAMKVVAKMHGTDYENIKRQRSRAKKKSR